MSPDNPIKNNEIKKQSLTLPNQLGEVILFTPATPAKTAVLVVHEWWGLTEHAKERAQRLAELGHAAMAVDMYGHGNVASTPEDAEAMMNAALAEPDKMNARFDTALALLQEQSGLDASHSYAMGYCFGGAVVLNQARRGIDLAGVASFHGLLQTDSPAQAGIIKAKMLVATGGADPMVSPDITAAFVAEMQQAEVDLQLLSFPNVQHGFTNKAATENGKKYGMPLAYDQHADETSWDALLQFLK